MNVIGGHATLLLKGAPTPSVERHARSIANNVNKISEGWRKLSTTFEVDVSDLPTESSLGQAIDEAVVRVRSLASERDIAMAVDMDDDSIRVATGSIQLVLLFEVALEAFLTSCATGDTCEIRSRREYPTSEGIDGPTRLGGYVAVTLARTPKANPRRDSGFPSTGETFLLVRALATLTHAITTTGDDGQTWTLTFPTMRHGGHS